MVIAGIVSVVSVSAIRSEKPQKGEQGIQGQQGIQGVKGDKGDKGQQGVQGERGLQGPKGESGAIGMPGKLGALASPVLPSPYFQFGGVTRWAGRSNDLVQSTTTPCSIQSPAATSTLITGSVTFSISSTTATTVDLAKAANRYASTTKLGATFTIPANGQATIVASTTGSGGDAIFAPNEWFVVKMAGNSPNGPFSPTGSCQATWEQL